MSSKIHVYFYFDTSDTIKILLQRENYKKKILIFKNTIENVLQLILYFFDTVFLSFWELLFYFGYIL